MPLPIWSFWIGPQPAWISLCLETLRRHNPELQLLDDTAWDTLYDGPVSRETIRLQAPNVQSDFLRAWLLVQHGGIWVDADCIGLRPLAGLEDVLGGKDFLAYKKGRVMSALLACQPGSRIAAEYLAEMVRKLQAPRRLSGMALGPWVLRRAIAQTRAPLALVPTELVHPAQGPRFGIDPRLQQPDGIHVRSDAFTCMLTHRALGQLARLGRDALLNHASITGQLFRRALGERGRVSTPVRDTPALTQPGSPVRVLIGALSGDAHADRRARCMDTWIPALEAHGIKTVFLRGNASPSDPYNLSLPVPDARDALSAKTQEFCRWALQRDDWDYVFKCDDDTFIHPARFVAFLQAIAGDYIGGRWRPGSSYASGGAGYFLSRRAAAVVAAADLPIVYAEDKVVGAALTAAGVEFQADQRFNAFCDRRFMRRDPTMITTHGVRTAAAWDRLAAFALQ